MLTLRKALVVLTALGTAFILTSSPAAAGYVPGEHVNLTISLSTDKVICGGKVTITTDARSGGTKVSGKLIVRAFGKKHVSSSNPYVLRVNTPVVTSATPYKVKADFIPDDPATYDQPPTATANIKLLPCGSISGSNNSLPDTGGLSIWYIILGGALLVVGAGVLLASARRRSDSSS